MSAFSLHNVNYKVKSSRSTLKPNVADRAQIFNSLYMFISTSSILTDNVKNLLNDYLSMCIEINQTKTSWFDDTKFISNVQYLLETICNKPINTISLIDVQECEGDICTSIDSVIRFEVKDTLYLDIVEYCKSKFKKHMRKSMEFESSEQEKHVKYLSEIYKKHDKRVISKFKEFIKNGETK